MNLDDLVPLPKIDAGSEAKKYIRGLLVDIRLAAFRAGQENMKAAAPSQPEQSAAQPPVPGNGSWIAAESVDRLARQLDVAMNGEEGAAKRPALCDVVKQACSIFAAQPEAQCCLDGPKVPQPTECPRCKNDISKCPRTTAQPSDAEPVAKCSHCGSISVVGCLHNGCFAMEAGEDAHPSPEVPTGTLCWLIEHGENPSTYFWYFDEFGHNFTEEAERAKRFVTEAAARKFIAAWFSHEIQRHLRICEHMFDCGISSAPSPDTGRIAEPSASAKLNRRYVAAIERMRNEIAALEQANAELDDSIQQQESAWKQRAENAEAEVKKLEFSWSGCATQLKDAIEELEIAESKAEELAKARAFMDEWEKAGGDAPHSVCSLRLRMEVQRNAAEKRINELQRGFGAAEEWGKLQAQLKEARDGWHVESGRADDAEARCKEMRGMLERCNTELRDSDLGGEIYALLAKEPQ